MATTPDVLLPDEWYSHRIQSEFFRAGLRMPVYADALSAKLGVPVPHDDHGMCFIPGIGDDLIAELWRSHGSPMHDRFTQENLCVLASPPLCLFDNTHLVGAHVQVDASGEPTRVVSMDSLPRDFNREVTSSICLAFTTFVNNVTDGYVVGARLNMLSSGLQNVVVFVHVPGGAPLTRQVYLPVLEHIRRAYDYTPPRCFGSGKDLRIRVIPRPVEHLDGFFGDLGKVICVSVDKIRDACYNQAFDMVQQILSTHMDDMVFRYLKMDKARDVVIIAVQHRDAYAVLDDDFGVGKLQAVCDSTEFRHALAAALSPMQIQKVTLNVQRSARRHPGAELLSV